MILGAILAGGRSQRFGSDKAMALLDGQPLIGHVAAALAPHVRQVVICGGAFPDYRGLADRPADNLGPLGGINAALAFAAQNSFDGVISLPCDTPLLDPALLERLANAVSPVYLRGLPVIGSWQASAGPSLDSFLATTRDRSMRRWIATIGAEPLDAPLPANVNWRSDLEALDG